MSDNLDLDSLAPELQDLLNGSIDDLPLDDYASWPDGTYLATCSAELKKVSDQTVVEFSYVLQEVKELSDPAEQAPGQGAKNSELCFVEHEGGRKRLGVMLKPFAEHFQVRNTLELIDMIKDVEVALFNKRRYDKKNDVWRFSVKEQAVG